MKNRIAKILVALTLVSSFAGCAGWQPKTNFGKAVVAWWEKPETQERVADAAVLARNYAINFALTALSQWAAGEEWDLQKVAVQGGVATLYQSASKIRQLQGTTQVLNPELTAQLLEQGGTSKEISQKLAGALVENAEALLAKNWWLTPDQAAEVNAAGLDRAAQLVETATK